jgi:hypothetical protein
VGELHGAKNRSPVRLAPLQMERSARQVSFRIVNGGPLALVFMI